MPTCDYCGDEIEFRYLDGRPTPIHVNGGWCTGYAPKKTRVPKGWFRSEESFTDPNAICPVCGATVFYYQNASGSRVFFDALGWPWPKHPCTDNPSSQVGKIKRPKEIKRAKTPSKANHANLYDLVESEERAGQLHLKFQNIANPSMTYRLQLAKAELEAQGWTESDMHDAPSFMIRRFPTELVIEFISVRKSAIGRLVVPRVAKPR